MPENARLSGSNRVRARWEDNIETHVVLSAVALVAASRTIQRHDKPGLIRSPGRLIDRFRQPRGNRRLRAIPLRRLIFGSR